MPTYIGVGPETTDFDKSLTVNNLIVDTLLTSPSATLTAGTVKAGSSSTSARIGGVIEVDIVSAATTAVTTEEILYTRSILGSTLAVDGQALEVLVGGSFAATATVKTVKVHFGGTSVTLNATTGSPNGVDFTGKVTIFRTSATAQLINKEATAGAVVQATGVTTAAETLANAITLKVTGQNGTANANDIVLKSVIVRVVN